MRSGRLIAIAVAACLAFAPALARAADVILNFSDLTQALTRPAYRAVVVVPGQQPTSDGVAVDISNSPQAALVFRWRQADLQVAYNPTVTRRDTFGPAGDRAWLVLHAGTISFSYTPEGQPWNVTLTQTGSIGQRNFATLTPITAAAPNSQPDPTMSRVNFIPNVTQQTLDVAAEQTSLTFGYQFTKRWRSSIGVAYGMSGGINGDEVVLPRQTTESATATVDHLLSRVDTLSTSVGASHTLVPTNGYEYWFAQASETWTRALTRELALSVSLGLVDVWSRCRLPSVCAATNLDLADGKYKSTLRPLASAGLRGSIFLLRRRHFVMSLLLGSALAPAVNPLNGELQTRLQGSATLDVAMDRTRLAATLDGAQTFPTDDPNAASVIGAGFLAGHHLTRAIELSAGYRTLWQFSNNTAWDIPRQWTLFGSILITAPPLRL